MILQKNKNLSIFNIFLILFLLSSIIISCSSTPKNNIPEPQWITDKKGAFPDSEYLAQLGTGVSANESRNNAIAQLASYFNTNVKSLVEGETVTVSSSDEEKARIQRTLNSTVVTSTDLDLFALETAEPYYLEREKQWYCCAFINRKNAWNQYEPLVRDEKNHFYSIYKLAEEQTEPLERIKTFTQAQAASEDFLSCLYRAYMFSKPLTDNAFGKDRAIIASIPGMVQKEKNNCTMLVKTNNDFGGTLSSSVTKIFSQLGFAVSTDNAKARYIVESTVNYNEIVQDDLIVYYPSIKVNISSANNAIYVYENKLDKILSYNESKAKKAACDSLAVLLEKDLPSDFKSTIGLSE